MTLLFIRVRRRVKQQKHKSNRSGNCTSGKAKVSQYIDLRLSSRRQCNITACKLKLTGAPPQCWSIRLS
jgi:hypothetical protein